MGLHVPSRGHGMSDFRKQCIGEAKLIGTLPDTATVPSK